MKNWRYGRALEVLDTFRGVESKIENLEYEIRNPWKPHDANSDIKGTRIDPDLMFGPMWSVENDRMLIKLKKIKCVVEKCFDDCGNDTETIIRELYVKKHPTTTLVGLVQSHKVKCGLTKAKRLRREFLDMLDEELDNARY